MLSRVTEWSHVFAWMVVCILTFGCGGGITQQPKGEEDRTLYETFYDLYSQYESEKNHPPSGIQDLSAIRSKETVKGISRVTGPVQDGSMKVYWGTSIKDGEKILAYNTDVPKDGGMVVLADGQIKMITASQFESLKPAGK
jgi:hypothetical protein